MVESGLLHAMPRRSAERFTNAPPSGVMRAHGAGPGLLRDARPLQMLSDLDPGRMRVPLLPLHLQARALNRR